MRWTALWKTETKASWCRRTLVKMQWKWTLRAAIWAIVCALVVGIHFFFQHPSIHPLVWDHFAFISLYSHAYIHSSAMMDGSTDLYSLPSRYGMFGKRKILIQVLWALVFSHLVLCCSHSIWVAIQVFRFGKCPAVYSLVDFGFIQHSKLSLNSNTFRRLERC